MSEEDQAHGNETSRNESPTADNNDIPNEYESLQRNIEEDIQYIGMHSLSESSQYMDTSSGIERLNLRPTRNNSSEYENHKSIKDRVDSCFESRGTNDFYENTRDYL